MSRPHRRVLTLVTVALVLGIIFLAYRWSMRVEPLNSDDVVLFGLGVEAAEGRHWLSAEEPLVVLRHSEMRLGILPFLVAAILVWGPTYAAYLAVSLGLAFLGFLLVWGIASREIDPLTGILVAALHLALPFELRDGGILLVDLPAAVFSVLTLLTIDWASGLSRMSSRWLGGALAGLAAFEAYLLRTNSVVLLLPALTVLALHRCRRLPSVAASGVLLVGFLMEQVLLMTRGLEFGYRWEAVRRALDSFDRFLPRYSPGEFWNRQFTALWEDFGGGFAGVFAVGCYIGFLACLIAMLVRARAPLLRALAALGLATYGAFAFGFSSWENGVIHALAPPLYRYFQPFYYTGLIAVAWVLGTWREHLVRHQESRRWLPGSLIAGVTSMLAFSTFSISADWVPRRLNDPCGELNQTLCAIDRLNETPSKILTTDRSARLMTLFRGPGSEPPVQWLIVPSAEVQDHLDRTDLVFLDWRRLIKNRRYLSETSKGRFDERLNSVRQELSNDFVLRKETPRFRLFQRANTEGFRSVPHGAFSSVDGARNRVEGWQTTVPLNLAPAGAGVLLRLPPSTHIYLFSGEGQGMRHPPPVEEGYAIDPQARQLSFRVALNLPPEVSAALFFLQYDASDRVGTERAPLRSGTNYVAFPVDGQAVSYRVGIRLEMAEQGGSEVPVTVHEIAFRSEPFEELCPCTPSE